MAIFSNTKPLLLISIAGVLMAGYARAQQPPAPAAPQFGQGQQAQGLTGFVSKNNQPTGPFTLRQIAEMALAGEVSQETLVWLDGMPNWQPAGQIQAVVDAVNKLQAERNAPQPPQPPVTPPGPSAPADNAPGGNNDGGKTIQLDDFLVGPWEVMPRRSPTGDLINSYMFLFKDKTGRILNHRLSTDGGQDYQVIRFQWSTESTDAGFIINMEGTTQIGDNTADITSDKNYKIINPNELLREGKQRLIRWDKSKYEQVDCDGDTELFCLFSSDLEK